MSSNIILFIPELIQSLKTWHQDFGFEPKTPVFSSLFAHYKSIDTSSVGLDRALFSTLGLPTEEELPIAQYRYTTNNKKTPQMLICADPVHCEVGINDITLTHVIDDFTRDEAEEIISQLNQHFSQDGLAFLLDDAQQWYLALPPSPLSSSQQQEAFESTELDRVIGKNIFPFLPKSEMRNWKVIQNEVQMLLHLSSINQSREIAGLSTANSLWFWGGGKEFIVDDTEVANNPANNLANNPVNMVFGNKNKASLIAKAGKCDFKPLPSRGDEIVKYLIEQKNSKKEQAETLVILDQLLIPALSNDLQTWQQQLNHIEQQFIEPLMQASKQGKITLQIDTCDGQRIMPLKIPVWKKLFQKPQSLFNL